MTLFAFQSPPEPFPRDYSQRAIVEVLAGPLDAGQCSKAGHAYDFFMSSENVGQPYSSEAAVERAVIRVLKPLNHVLEELAAAGWIVTLRAAGHLYEAWIYSHDEIITIRPQEATPGDQ
jgi:hypothetical protein